VFFELPYLLTHQFALAAALYEDAFFAPERTVRAEMLQLTGTASV